MRIREFVLRLAALYDIPIHVQGEDEDENGKKINYENPKILGAEKWVDDNFIDGKQLGLFYKFATNNFIPTDAVRYPTPGNLEKLLKEYRIKKPEIKKYEPITFDEAQKIYAEKEGVQHCVPDEYKDIDISVVAEDAKKLNATQLLKKYGVSLCGEYWSDGLHKRKVIDEQKNNR